MPKNRPKAFGILLATYPLLRRVGFQPAGAASSTRRVGFQPAKPTYSAGRLEAYPTSAGSLPHKIGEHVMNDPRPPLTFHEFDQPPPTTQPKKLGRPRSLDDAKKREICALIAAGGGMVRASKYVGCRVETVMNEARRDPDFAAKLHRAEAQAELDPINALRSKCQTHWRAAAYFLEKVSDDRKSSMATDGFDQQCLRDFRHNFKALVTKEVTDPKLRGRIHDSFMACFCTFTRELGRMLPLIEIDFDTQSLWEQKLKAKGFLPIASRKSPDSQSER